MKKLAFILIIIPLGALAQSNPSIGLDTLQKIIGIIMIGGGVFIGYLQMRLASKLAEQEIKFNTKLDALEEKITLKLDNRDLKMDNRIKDVENRMATHHDINGLKQIMVLQHENVKETQENIKDQLKMAANTYKRDRE